MLGIQVFGVADVQAQLQLEMSRSIKSVGDAVELNTRMLLVRVGQRLFGPRRTNIQDFDIGKKVPRRQTGATRASVSADGLTGTVTLGGIFVRLRRNAADAVISRHMGAQALERTGLWLQPSATGKGIVPTRDREGQMRPGMRDRPSRSGLKFFAFAGNSRLEKWASRPDRGAHVLRNSIYVDNTEVLMQLIAGPVLSRSRAEIMRNFELAVQSGWRR
jgi:hypothetical protein